MTSYREHLAQHLRLAILRCLAEAPGYSLNTSILRDAVGGVGLPASRDLIETEGQWLAEQGHATRAELPAGVVILTLTVRGLDVAAGRAAAPGVQRPAPRG